MTFDIQAIPSFNLGGALKTLVIATSNLGKLGEFRELFEGMHIRILSLKDIGFTEEIEESGSTFLANARIKAEAVASKTEFPVLADDSGLCVAALGGAPGIFTARFAGIGATHEANRSKLLFELDSHQAKTISERKAAFVCALSLVSGSNLIWECESRCEGSIAVTEKGSGGFGYDPLFIPEGYSITFAEMDAASKHALSHRGKAFFALKQALLQGNLF